MKYNKNQNKYLKKILSKIQTKIQKLVTKIISCKAKQKSNKNGVMEYESNTHKRFGKTGKKFEINEK